MRREERKKALVRRERKSARERIRSQFARWEGWESGRWMWDFRVEHRGIVGEGGSAAEESCVGRLRYVERWRKEGRYEVNDLLGVVGVGGREKSSW